MLAAVFGILSAMLMLAFLASRGGDDTSANNAMLGGPAESVVTVSKDIPFGTEITSDMLTVSSLPQAAAVQGHATRVEDVVGKVATTPLFKGQQLLTQQFTTFAGQNALTYKVPAGMRAISVQVPHEGWIVGGLPQPGDHVDFLAITTLSRTDPLTGQERPDVRADYLGQDIEVLALAQTIVKTIPKAETTPAAGATAASGTAVAQTTPDTANSDLSGKPLADGTSYEKAISVTLAVTPDLAAKIGLIDAMKKEVGQWRLVLRRQGDAAPITGSKSFSYEDLFPGAR